MLDTTATTFEYLPTDLLDRDPQQVRQVKPSMEARAALNASVAERGILEPLLVRPNPEAEGRYLIVFGEGRWIAAKAAKLATVPAIIRTDMTDADVTASQAAENLVRNDMHPVDQWRAVAKLIEQGHEINSAAAIVGVTSEREMRRLQKLGKLSPKLLDAMTGNTFPDDSALSTIALAPTEVQEKALKAGGKWADGVNWYEVAQHCSTKRLSSKLAIFNIETARVVFTEDLFAEPGTNDQFTTSDIPGFLKAQRAALDAEAKVASAHIQVVEWHRNQSSPALPKGWNRIYARDIPKRFKKDDPRMVYAAVCPEGYYMGQVQRILCTPAEPSEPRAERSEPSPGTAGDPETPAPRDPITKAGKDLIAAAKGDAVRAQLADPALGLQGMLRLLLVAIGGNNVTIQGGGTSYHRSSIGDLLLKMVDADGTLIPLTDDALTEIAAEVIGRIVVFESPINTTHSGPVAEWIGAAVGAELALPRFDTEEFLKCCTGAVLMDAAAQAEISPAKTTAALRKQLLDHAPAFVPPLCKFGAPGPVPYLSDPDDEETDPDALADGEGARAMVPSRAMATAPSITRSPAAPTGPRMVRMTV